MGLEPSDFDGCRSFSEMVDRIYDDVARREGKVRWGDKTPEYVTEIPTLLRLFPHARIVHIYRDGRDVALSTLRLPRRPNTVYAAARAWSAYVATGRRDGARIPGSYAEVRYEDLTSRPREVLGPLCEFLGEEFHEDMLQLDLGARWMWSLRRDPGLRDTIGARSEIVSDNSGKWREAMDRSERGVFESVAGDRLAELGYEVEGLARSIGRGETIRLEVEDRARSGLHLLRAPMLTAGTYRDSREPLLRARLARVKHARRCRP